jgi:hypothetical protein
MRRFSRLPVRGDTNPALPSVYTGDSNWGDNVEVTADHRETDRDHFEDLLLPLVKPAFRLAYGMLQVVLR